MFVVIWRFTTRNAIEFERHYRSDGTWAQLFRTDPQFIRTDLLKAADHYLTLDCWTSREAYDAFRDANAERYAEIDRMCESLTISEEKVGEYETS